MTPISASSPLQHAHEAQRLQALQRYAILDTPPEPSFDRITRLTAKLLGVPFAAITFVDEQHQWYKSRHGLSAMEHPRDHGPCSHAIQQEGLTVISDAQTDERFREHPLVAADPKIDSYAAAPLRSPEGFALGTLCVMDTLPREFTLEDQQTLLDLAALVTDMLELRLVAYEKNQQAAAVFQIDLGVVVNNPSLPDSPIVFANPRFCEMTGYQPSEILGLNCRFLQGPETSRETIDEIRNAIAARRTFRGELLNYRKDGTPFWNELTVSPVFDDAGELISFIGIQSDVTERRRAADHLRQTLDKLREVENMRDSLTEMIIHDLRSPLTSIIGFLDLLHAVSAAKLEAKEVQFIEHARRGAATVSEMVTSLLDVSRLESGQMPLNVQRADLQQIISAATNPFLASIGNRRLHREVSSSPIQIHCDAELVQRVITNLVSNAVKFTPALGEIRVSAALSDAHVKISVTDTGVGIPEEFHSRIFEKFGQVEGRRHHHSTGLGLTFCKLAIEAQNGTIGLRSTPGLGTTMWFTLPLASAIAA